MLDVGNGVEKASMPGEKSVGRELEVHDWSEGGHCAGCDNPKYRARVLV